LKRDIRINYSVLESISLNIKKYKNAIETIRQVLSFVNNKLEDENQGEAIEVLKDNYTDLEGDLEGCKGELNDLYTIFDGYICEMQDIIRPVSSSNMMQVGRNDIWWNMKDIFRACDEVGHLKINVGMGMSLPNLFQSDEDKANAEKNSRMMEDIGDDIKYCYNRLNEKKDDIQYIYDKKIIPYENKDDEYSNKAARLHIKYTNMWESTVEEGKDFGLTGINIGKGLVDLGADLLKGAYGLAKGAVVIVGAGAAMKSMMETGDAPDCLKKCITKTEGYGKTASAVLKDPIILAEGMAQGASDTIEEKGIAYSTSYVLGGVLLTKGISKASSGFKARKAANIEKVSTKLDKGKAKFAYKNNPMDNPKASKDIIESPECIYGYSPKPESSLSNFKVDWTNPDQVADAKFQRIKYHEGLEIEKTKLNLEGQNLIKEGYSIEDVARMKVNERNAHRINSYIKDGNLEGLESMRARNMRQYQNPDGPTPEQLFKKYSSWEEVINSSVRSNPGMDACTGLYDVYGGK